MSDHHVRWSSFQWWTSLCWSYLLYDSRSTFRSQCSEAISAYARLFKFNPSIRRVQNWLAPIVCERKNLSHPIITWDGVVFNGEHHYVDHIYYMFHARPFGLSVPRPYLHMLGSSSLTRVFCVCKTGLHPFYVNVRIYHTRSSRGASKRRTVATVHS